MAHVFKKLPVGGAASVFKSVKTYRGGSACAPSITSLPLGEALAGAKTKVTFLESESLKGMPVNAALSTKTIDPFLVSYAKDVKAAFFSE